MKTFPIPYIDAIAQVEFWELVDKHGGSEHCWNWTGNRWASKKGIPRYGAFNYAGRTYLPHRIAWTLSFGDIPDGILVCHKCDNGLCCNPGHLFLGTQSDNIRDRDRKGRRQPNSCIPRGEGHTKVKITEEQVREIRRLYQPWKMPCRVLAKMFGMTDDGIYSIITRRTWKHIA